MDLSGGFSFHESNSSVTDDQLESPKSWPQISNLQISDGSADDNNQDPKTSSALNSNVAKISVIEVSNPVKESSANKSEFKQPMPPTTKVRRAKVPFEKGYSPMDWLKLTQTHKDLAGLKGRSNRRLISLDEVKKHKTEGDCWTILKGCVYNISPYLKFHPGGVDMLMKAAGKDCTTLFNKYHAWVNAEFLMEKCLVGILDVPAS